MDPKKGSAINGDLRRAHRVARLIVGGVLLALLAHGLGPAWGHAQGAPGPIPTDRELKVAFIGDTGNGAGFRRVLELIKSEGAHLVLHQGDFDYRSEERRVGKEWRSRRASEQ